MWEASGSILQFCPEAERQLAQDGVPFCVRPLAVAVPSLSCLLVCLSDLTGTQLDAEKESWWMFQETSPVDLSRVKQRPVPSSHGSLLRRIPGGYLAQIYKQSISYC